MASRSSLMSAFKVSVFGARAAPLLPANGSIILAPLLHVAGGPHLPAAESQA